MKTLTETAYIGNINIKQLGIIYSHSETNLQCTTGLWTVASKGLAITSDHFIQSCYEVEDDWIALKYMQ
jgi:hypothetical protein